MTITHIAVHCTALELNAYTGVLDFKVLTFMLNITSALSSTFSPLSHLRPLSLLSLLSPLTSLFSPSSVV